MLGKSKSIEDGMKFVFASFWITFCACVGDVRCQEGNGCGHALLGTESGTIASPNYPGTYPSNAWCKWRLRVQEGRTLRLLFGDFDIESSPGCRNGSIVITGKSGERRLGPVCGKLNATMNNVTLETNEVTVTFMSGPHRSGRGFLLSYATDQHPDLISCLQRGSHFSFQHLRVYCPAGCKNVPGEIWGNSEQGYRDTSVLCKSAVHSGATSDALGGRITVNQGRSLTLYESTFANGVLSKTGSLSDKKLLFSKECSNILAVSALNASSFWDKNSQEHTVFSASRNTESSHDFLLWTADHGDPNPWVEIELSERSTVTGLVTTGSSVSYMESYSLQFSKDRKSWKTYKDAMSKEKKVFQAYTDGHLRVLNSLFPAVVARFVRLQPLSWHTRASARVQLLGCPAVKVTPRSRPPGAESPSIKFNMDTLNPSPSPTPTEKALSVETTLTHSQPVIIAVGVVLGLVMCGSCLLARIWWKRRKKDSVMKNSLPTVGCQAFKAKSLPCPQSELISYPLVRSVHDALPSPPLNDYAAPAIPSVGQKVGSTFRPSSDEGYTTPFTCAHYDTPGNLPEYAEPLPPEPEYATPFSELPPEHKPPSLSGLLHGIMHRPAHAPSGHSQYDCPSHRVLFNGYCTPALHASGPRPASEVYAEPKPSDSLVQKHTYEEPL
ncbi:discoidin, CUB and LCCL domain-containing protein 1-like isoform X1 [Xiphophorus maculatus]|uniref:discoidin, CUB and LCCL domain-containing protein 1-like isoform X1 n=1 Tax=Xiphophorus maculatus TaxID=8083 RepID=UPI0003B3E8FA|nr:discoidin, CUB and LCCL domain-containing protein 1-like isoform X1 [Xiphophorus maculatus]